MPRRLILTVAISALLALGGFALAAAQDPGFTAPAVKTVEAPIVNTLGGTIGVVELQQDAAGVVLLRVDVGGLPAGAHGIHIHSVGTCQGPAFATAGAHFNPSGTKHGIGAPGGPHAGDLAQIPATFSGTGLHFATTNRISLTGGTTNIFDADGSALVIHASADDQTTDPTGNSGGRIACAVIAAPTAPPATATAAPAPVQAPRPPATGTGAGDSGSRFAVLGGLVLAVIGLAGVIARATARKASR